MNTQQAIDEFVQTKRSLQTQRSYNNALQAFTKSFTMGDVSDLQVEAIQVFVRDALTKHYSASTANLYASCLRGFVKYLMQEGHIEWSAADLSKMDGQLNKLRPESRVRLPKLPEQESVEAIRAAAVADEHWSPICERNTALIEVLYSTGCRIDEVVNLKIRDINTKQREARVIGKGNKQRVVFLSPTAVNACIRYWYVRTTGQGNSQDSPAFARHDDGAGKRKPLKHLTTQGARNVVLELAAAAGVEHFTPHSFRHYFATRMLRETNDISLVQLAMGHESPDTTKVYAKADPDIVRRAHREVFGQ